MLSQYLYEITVMFGYYLLVLRVIPYRIVIRILMIDFIGAHSLLKQTCGLAEADAARNSGHLSIYRKLVMVGK